MEILKAALSGIIQGLTEFLPVSSSGHLALFFNIFDFNIDGGFLLFALILHLGTLAAVFIAYAKDIKELFIAFLAIIVRVFTGRFKYKSLGVYERFVIFIFIATVPLAIGAFIDSRIAALANNSKLIGGLLLINAVILFASDKIKAKHITEKTASPKNALLVGLAQLIAVVPGISRSGATITSGLLNGFTRTFAVKFSLIMSIPAIIGSSVFHFIDAARSDTQITKEMLSTSVIGFLFAFIFGFAAIIFIRIIAANRKFWVFSIWCAIVGLLALIFG